MLLTVLKNNAYHSVLVHLHTCTYQYNCVSSFCMNHSACIPAVPVTRWGDTLMELTIREQKLDILKYLISECIVNVNSKLLFVYKCVKCVLP